MEQPKKLLDQVSQVLRLKHLGVTCQGSGHR
jgi:hypothetical protein